MNRLSTISSFATTLIFAAQMMFTTAYPDTASESPAERLLRNRPAKQPQAKAITREGWGLPYNARTIKPFDVLKHQYRLPSVLEPRLPQFAVEMTV